MWTIWTTKCNLGDVFTLRGIYWSTQFVLTAENDPYASGHLHWSRDSLRAPSPGWLAHTHCGSVKWNSPNGIRIGDGTCIGGEGAFGFLRLFGGGRGLASSRMRKVSIQRGWPPPTPIALNTKDGDGIGLIDLARGNQRAPRSQHRQARSFGWNSPGRNGARSLVEAARVRRTRKEHPLRLQTREIL